MRGTLRRPRSAALLAAALLALSVLATAAVANTVSGHQNPHLVVVAKVTRRVRKDGMPGKYHREPFTAAASPPLVLLPEVFRRRIRTR